MQTRPDPGSAATAEEFLEALRQLRAWAGRPSLRTLNALGGTDPDSGEPPADLLPVSTLSDNLAGKRLPNPPRLAFVVAFVTACMRAKGSHTPEEISAEEDRWTQAWLTLSPAQDAPETPLPASAPAPEEATDLPEDPAPRTKRRLPVMAWLLGVATGAVLVGVITLAVTGTPPRHPTASTEDAPPASRTPPPPTETGPTPSAPTGSAPVSDYKARTDTSNPAPAAPSPPASKPAPSPPSLPAPSKSPTQSPSPTPYTSYYNGWTSHLPKFTHRPYP